MGSPIFISCSRKAGDRKTRKTEDFSAQLRDHAPWKQVVDPSARHQQYTGTGQGKDVRKRSQFCDAAFHAKAYYSTSCKDISDWL